MKKVLLGLFALSAMAMGATNPGHNETEAKANNSIAVAGVPMEVRVEILPAEKRLILVDENNRKIDKLVFDHGKLIKSNSTPDSVVEKTVKLMVEDGSPLGQNHAIFVARQAGKRVDSTTSNLFKLDMYGSKDGGKIDSELNYKQGIIDVDASQSEVSTKVISTLKSSVISNTATKTGLYTGSGTFEAAITSTKHKETLKTF